MPRTLIDMWPNLTSSAQQMLCRAAEELMNGHSGVIEFVCLNGGIRKLRIGSEYQPKDFEYRLGPDDDNTILPLDRKKLSSGD